MMRTLGMLSLAALLAVPAAQAEARPAHHVAKPQPNAAIKARESAMNGFTSRMSRLDALMGSPSPAPARSARSRSAEAGR